LGGLGGVSFTAQVIGTLAGIVVALLGGFIVYGLVSKFTNIRLSEEEEFKGADLSIHSIGSVNHD
jgi:Amt family ammonium transporter